MVTSARGMPAMAMHAVGDAQQVCRISVVKADALALHRDRIAVDQAGRTSEISEGQGGREGQEGDDEAHKTRIARCKGR